ncbi:MAG TPA: Na+/H+ antiporter subunit E [Thermoleophilaceae bacterium]|nr:Na+/H+ antiporter subunit E [Thermoleophilaceae bacterium]
MRYVLTLAGLTAVYALTLASLHPLDLATGLLVSAALLAVGRRFVFAAQPEPAREVLRRIAALPRFFAGVVAEVASGTLEVALVVLGRRPLDCPGIVAIPIEERTPIGVAVAALAFTLSPGDVLIDVDEEEQVMLIHVLDASDPEAVRARHRSFYERWQRRAFP